MLALQSLAREAGVPGCPLIAQLEASIAERYAEKIRVAELAAQLHVSVRTLQNLCQAHYGQAPLKVLRAFRLQRLCLAMQERPWAPLRTLFDQCGLTGGIADRDQFLEMFGLAIAEYQRACRCKQMPRATGLLTLNPGSALSA